MLNVKTPQYEIEDELNPSHDKKRIQIRAVGIALVVLAVVGFVKWNPTQKKVPITARIIASADVNTGSLAFGQGDVCIPASGTTGLGYAKVIVPSTGTISGITMYYQSGQLNHCGSGNPNCIGKWGGQKSTSNPNGNLNIHITRDVSAASSNILYPKSGTAGYTTHDSWGFYSMTGYHAESNVVTFSGPSHAVTQFEVLRVYYGEPLFHSPSSDNSGSTCAGVVLTYSTSSVSVSYLSMPSLGPQWTYIPSQVCVQQTSGGVTARETAYFNGILNGKPQWYHPASNLYLHYSSVGGARWRYGQAGSTGYSRCPNANDDPFTCAWNAYQTKIAPFAC